MRGRNFTNSFIIVDEAQNVTDSQMEMVVSRLCIGSKMVIVGDTSQIDLRSKKDSGMFFIAKKIAGTIPGVIAVNLKTNHRHPIVESVLGIYKELKEI
jgi:phosphate starvation-inducible PhoH-like protein